MKNSRMLLVYFAALITACSRQSDATPLPRAELAPTKDIAPPAQTIPIKPAVEVAEKPPAVSQIVPAATQSPAHEGRGTKDEGREQISRPSPPVPRPSPDTGAKLLDELLRPQDGGEPLFTKKPRRRPGLASLEKPTVPAQAPAIKLPRVSAQPAAKPVRPHALSEGLPLYSRRTPPRLPAEIHFPTGSLASAPSPNPDNLPPLPTLAQRQPDRASLGDPTAEFSTAAALAGSIPSRTSAAPFIRQNLPDPFEHKQAVRLRTPPPEDTTLAN